MSSSCWLNTFHIESRLFLNSHIQRYNFLNSCNLWTFMNLFYSTVTYTCSWYVSSGITVLNLFILHSFLLQQRPRWVVLYGSSSVRFPRSWKNNNSYMYPDLWRAGFYVHWNECQWHTKQKDLGRTHFSVTEQ